MRLVRLLCVGLSLLTMYGCRSAPMTYYTLTPTDRSGPSAESGRLPLKTLLVLRSLPAGMDTSEMLIRTDDTRLRVEEGGRWAAPFGEELRAALIDGLHHQYGIVVLDSAPHGDGPVPRIDLTVRKYEVVEGSSVTLAVDWVLSNTGHEPGTALSCQAELRETSGGTLAGVVGAGQAAVLKLSRALGAALEASSRGSTPQC